MGNGYNNQLQKLYQKSSFFPMLCRLSIKDVTISTYKDHSSSILDDPSSPKVSCIGQVKKNNRVISYPSNNFKLSSTSSAKSTPIHHHNQQYMKITKLKKFFSSKNLVSGGNSMAVSPSAIIKNSKRSGSRSCRSGRNKEMMVIKRGVIETGKRVCKNANGEYENGVLDMNIDKRVCKDGNGECKNGVFEVNIDKLDPPLPVVKKVQQSGGSGGGDEVNLWQRRRFVAVKSLQIEQIHLPNNNCVLPTTV